MNAQLEAIIQNAKDAWERERHDGREKITVVLDTSSMAQGAEATIAAFRDEVEKRGLAADVGIAGSWGFCWMEPTVLVRSAAGTRAVLYANVTADIVPDFVERVVVGGQDMPELALGVVEGSATAEIPLLDDHPFMKGQVRRLMANVGKTDPENIDHYIAHGGYAGLGRALELDAEAIIKEMLDSGLGGRGGGGFPVGRKWDFLRTASAEPKYLVCNADEGDPGAWVNRILMEGEPHLIVEGMIISALATGASEGYIYVRHEYPLSVHRLNVAVQQAREKGILGDNFLGTGKNFDLVVFMGAGSYVCGEETGLINSIDGFRGMPRIRPPFPAQAGLWNKPTNVNNVESYANAPLIFREGAEWWKNINTTDEKGTKMFTFSGQINWQGCVEIPWGMTVRQALEQYGGGMREGSTLKGFQPGGPLSGILTADEADLTLTLGPYRERGIFLGSGGIVFFDHKTSILDLCMFFLGFCEDESCGRCTTCHGGTQRAVEIVRRIASGGGRVHDIEQLESLANTLVWSNCLHGQFSMTATKLALRGFRDEFEYIVRDKRDPTGSLPNLVDYSIISQADTEALEVAEDICPTDAIYRDDQVFVLDDARCIRCGACKEVAPNAITVRDRFPAATVVVADAAGG